jgi:hypothetical protein
MTTEPILLDRDGRFDVRGKHIKEHGGPIRANENSSHAARYTGTVIGQEMTFTVVLIDTGESVGTFKVTHGRKPRIVKIM